MRAEREKKIKPLRRSLALLGIRGGSFGGTGVGFVVGGGGCCCCDEGGWVVLLLSVVGVVVDGADDGFPSGKSHRLRSQDILAFSCRERMQLSSSNVMGIERRCVSSGTKEKLGRHRTISFFYPGSCHVPSAP